MKFVFTLCSLFFIGFASANSFDSLRSEQRADGLFVIHQVEEKETMYSIARRYGGTVAKIIEINDIQDNTIDIGQIIEILVEKKKVVEVAALEVIPENVHEVQKGETLYGIAQKHNIRLKELRKINDLEGNAISPGMLLILKDGIELNKEEIAKVDTVKVLTSTAPVVVKVVKTDPYLDFKKYLVQTGENLYTIATKIGVSMDSLKKWNALDSDFLKIGQQLHYKQEVDSIDSSIVSRGKSRTQIDEDGFERVFEEGVTSVIESMSTTRFLALHRTLPIGTSLEVRNLMNNQVVHVKVVGRLPNTGLNKNLLLRISQPAYDQLRILDPKSRVEVSYFKQ
jgi:LysM repeat protein